VQRLLEQLARALNARKIQSDAPTDADLENWGFNQPAREVLLTFSPGAECHHHAPKLQIGVTTPRDDRAYARLAGERFVYAVDPLDPR
jgi:hypothetical protein